jgi:hypothetical protein
MNATLTAALQLATQQLQEHKERLEKTELQTTPNEEGKAKKDHPWPEKKLSRSSSETGHPFNITQVEC